MGVLGREIVLDGVLTKTCESCDGTGEIHTVREARLDELTHAQSHVLLRADMYRETGGEDEQQDMREARQQANRVQRSPQTARMPSTPHH